MAGPAPVALSSGFWTLTFWGIAGTISGIIGTSCGAVRLMDQLLCIHLQETFDKD